MRPVTERLNTHPFKKRRDAAPGNSTACVEVMWKGVPPAGPHSLDVPPRQNCSNDARNGAHALSFFVRAVVAVDQNHVGTGPAGGRRECATLKT
jgi:hypothetical protein